MNYILLRKFNALCVSLNLSVWCHSLSHCCLSKENNQPTKLEKYGLSCTNDKVEIGSISARKVWGKCDGTVATSTEHFVKAPLVGFPAVCGIYAEEIFGGISLLPTTTKLHGTLPLPGPILGNTRQARHPLETELWIISRFCKGGNVMDFSFPHPAFQCSVDG